MKVVDVNILIYAINHGADQHEAARQWWEAAIDGDESIGLSWATVVGFLRMTTNPRILATPLSGTTAMELVHEWFSLPNVGVLLETRDHWKLLQELIRSIGVTGDLVPDAHLAALAMSHGAILVSCDSDFARFPELRWENPLEVG